MKIYIIWLVGVIIWNFGYPSARPIEDVIAAIILSLMSYWLKKNVKFLNYKKIQKDMKKNKLPTNKEFIERFIKLIDDFN